MARLQDWERQQVCLVARQVIVAFADDATYEDGILGVALLEWLRRKDERRWLLADRIARRWWKA